jgi:hypothetical protein
LEQAYELFDLDRAALQELTSPGCSAGSVHFAGLNPKKETAPHAISPKEQPAHTIKQSSNTAELRVRSHKGHRVLEPMVSQAELAAEMFTPKPRKQTAQWFALLHKGKIIHEIFAGSKAAARKKFVVLSGKLPRGAEILPSLGKPH